MSDIEIENASWCKMEFNEINGVRKGRRSWYKNINKVKKNGKGNKKTVLGKARKGEAKLLL